MPNAQTPPLPLQPGTYFSRALQREQPFIYLAPPGWNAQTSDPSQRFPLLVLLHGYTGSHSDWPLQTRLPHYAASHNLFIAFPYGGNGFYTNAIDGTANYEDDLINDFLPHLQATFPLLPPGKHWGLGGLSMGGYGALKNALKHPGLFSVAYGSSSACEAVKDPRWVSIFGDVDTDAHRAHRRANNLHALAEDALSRWPSERPRLLFDCGLNDERLEINRRFHQHLNFIGYRHDYDEAPGHHTWPYWNRRIRTVLPTIAAYLSA